MLGRVVLSGLKKFFRLMNQLSLCLSKEKVAKRKDPSRGRLLVHDSNVALTRSRSCAGRRCPAAWAARPSSMTASCSPLPT